MPVDRAQGHGTGTGDEFDDSSLSSSATTVLISNRSNVTQDNKYRMASSVSHNESENDVDTFSFSRDPSGAANPSVFASVAVNPEAVVDPQPVAAGAAAANPQPAAAADQDHLPAEVNTGEGSTFSALTSEEENLEHTEDEKARIEAIEAQLREIKAAARKRKRLKNKKLHEEEEDARRKKKLSENDDQDKGNGPGGVLGGGAAVAK